MYGVLVQGTRCRQPAQQFRGPNPCGNNVCHRQGAAQGEIPPLPSQHGVTNKRRLNTANFPMDNEGRTYHVGTKRGEVANRVLAVGSLGRARMLASLLSPLPGHSSLCVVESSRGFLTVTGLFRGFPVSVITHLMGFANLDLMLRETRAVADPPLLVIRIGTCGSLNGQVGQLHIARDGSVAVLRNPDAFHPDAVNGASEEPYCITRPVPADRALSAALERESRAVLGGDGVHCGLNASADSFFSSQGRLDAHFSDRNAAVLDELQRRHPDVSSLEMETFHLFHLAQCSGGDVRAAAGVISLANRTTDEFIDTERIPVLERAAGEAALRALVTTPVEDSRGVDIAANVSIWAD